jgi:hypothetical protein
VDLQAGALVLRFVADESRASVVLRDVEVLVGSADIAPGALGDRRLAEAWRARQF